MNERRWQFVWWGRWPAFKHYAYPYGGRNRGKIYSHCFYFGLFEIRRFADD